MILSLQVGSAREITTTGSGDWWDRDWTTGFMKQPVPGRVWLAYGGLHGDEQADRQHHGGVDKAVCVYPSEHYPHWRQSLALPLGYGGFGENFTTQGLLETDVCIGDIYQAGEARLQVSQPRQPCWKLARRWRVKNLTALVEQTGFTGFYFRVLRHGWVEAGQLLELMERPCSKLTIAHANQIMHHDKHDLDSARALAECSALSASWKDSFWHRVVHGKQSMADARIQQP